MRLTVLNTRYKLQAEGTNIIYRVTWVPSRPYRERSSAWSSHPVEGAIIGLASHYSMRDAGHLGGHCSQRFSI